jgi:hypothetical protein
MVLYGLDHSFAKGISIISVDEIEERFFRFKELAGRQSKDLLELGGPPGSISFVEFSRPCAHPAGLHSHS